MTTENNATRADRAFRLTLVYRQWIGADEDDPETVLADLLADLMHNADTESTDFDAVLDRARRRYEDESGPECESCRTNLPDEAARVSIVASGGFSLCDDCAETVEVV